MFRHKKNTGDAWLDSHFWKNECKKIPEHALFVKIVMGTVIDYFRPTFQNTFCDMLTNNNKHDCRYRYQELVCNCYCHSMKKGDH